MYSFEYQKAGSVADAAKAATGEAKIVAGGMTLIPTLKLRLAQPSVSKHLRVLLDVGLVRMRREGRQVLYRTNAEALQPLHEWARRFERYWRGQLGRVKERAEHRENRTQENKPRRRQP